jgi:hypothetical protein
LNRSILLSGPLALYALVWPYYYLNNGYSTNEVLSIVALRGRSLDAANRSLARIRRERHMQSLITANTVPAIVLMARTLVG